ncbi:hypothetical protein [Dictyobacter alpinus]|uniref:hypothetical protein n=1 Tax=Dictyobacter alpinus TaxID=2014873 RepID=UPI000F841387|nr:hypothetical protein [Dictyobacter alpinus]
MPSSTLVPIGTEDQYLIENNHLGIPLSVYGLKKRRIRSLTFMGWLACTSSILGLLILIVLTLANWQQIFASTIQHLQNIQIAKQMEMKQTQLDEERFLLIRSFVVFGCLFLFGMLLLLVSVPSLKKRRVIVCKYGLLQVHRRMGRNHIDIMRWEEIQSLQSKRTFLDRHSTYLLRKQGKPFILSHEYKDFGALFTQIKQYSQMGAAYPFPAKKQW